MKCLCGETTRPVTLDRRGVISGQRQVTFVDVPAERCPECHELYFTPEVSSMMLWLAQSSSRDVVPFPNPGPLSPDEIVAIRSGMRMSQARLSKLLGLSVTAVAAWEQGRRKPDGPSRVLLRLVSLMSQTEPERPRSRRA